MDRVSDNFGLEHLIPESDENITVVSTKSETDFKNDVATLYSRISDILETMHFHINRDMSNTHSTYKNKEMTLLYTINNLENHDGVISKNPILLKMLSQYDAVKESKNGELLLDQTDGKITLRTQHLFGDISKKNTYVILHKNLKGVKYNIIIQNNNRPKIDYDTADGLHVLSLFEEEMSQRDNQIPFGYDRGTYGGTRQHRVK